MDPTYSNSSLVFSVNRVLNCKNNQTRKNFIIYFSILTALKKLNNRNSIIIMNHIPIILSVQYYLNYELSLFFFYVSFACIMQEDNNKYINIIIYLLCSNVVYIDFFYSMHFFQRCEIFYTRSSVKRYIFFQKGHFNFIPNGYFIFLLQL